MRQGVFCLEGQWSNNLDDRSSVLPTLELLERLGEFRFIHKDVATIGELHYFLRRWTLRAYERYRVCYLAMHGNPAELELSRGNSVKLNDLAEILEGQCDGRRLYFGSCMVLDVPDETLRDFLKVTRAELVCGYTKEVEWDESSAFDMMLLPRLAWDDERELLKGRLHWAPLIKQLGFRIVYRDGRKNPRIPAQPAIASI